MTFRIAGSGCWGTMVKRPDGSYDLDYQIFITHNSKDFENIVIKHPEIVKNDIRAAFDNLKNKGESFKDSTTAITLINKNESVHYSIDFVIITDIDGKSNIIRQDKKSRPPRYFWNELPSRYNESYAFFKQLDWRGKKEIVDKVIIRKCQEMHKQIPDKSSSELLIEEINNHVRKRVHH